MRRTVAVLAALLLAPGALWAQGKEEKAPKPPCAPKPGRAIVRGTLVDSVTSLPLDGAGIVLRWGAGSGGELREKKEGETDHSGRFRMCDAPLGTLVVVQANFWGQHTEQRLTPADTAAEPLDLRLDAPHSLLQGRVVDPSNQPVSGASVRLEGLPEPQISDPTGAFNFGRIPPGPYEVKVEHLAYTTVVDTLEVDFSGRVDATIHVAPGVISLEPITVVVRSLVLEKNGFYDRQKYGHGAFITRLEIQRQNPSDGSQILERVAGVRLQARRFGDRSVATARAGCAMRFIVDGVRTTATYSIDYVSVGDIEGLEIYLGPSQVPSEFSAFPGETGGSCGLVIVWTRQNLKI